MMKKATFTNWDFENIWSINEDNDYPVFKSENNSVIDTPDQLYELPISFAPPVTPDYQEAESDGYIDPEQDIPLFEPDEYATREFAAYTLVKAMGNIGEYSIDCIDSSEIKYLSETAVAVQQGFFKLENNRFNPKNYLTGTDKNRIIIAVSETNKSVTITDEYDNTVYLDSVVKEQLSIEYDSDGKIYVNLRKNDITVNLENVVFVLPENDEFRSGIALKVINYSKMDSNSVELICIKPKVQEIASKIDFAGYGSINIEDIVVSDGVTLNVIEEGSSAKSRANWGGTFKPGTTLNFEYNGADFSFKLEEIAAKLDADIGLTNLKLNEFLFTIKNINTIKASFEGVAKKEHKFATIPIIIGTTGLKVDVDVIGKIGADGSVEMSLK